MKVPRIALNNDLKVATGIAYVIGINTGDKTFLQRHREPGDTDGTVTIRPLSEYDPAPTWTNFIRAVDQWDYYSNMSDSAAVITEGKEMTDALKLLFKQLPKNDQHRLQKIVDIVVNV